MSFKLVIALVIGVMAMGILTQFVDTADRSMLRDMRVIFDINGDQLKIEVYDAQSGDPLTGSTIKVEYPGGTLARSLAQDSHSHTFSVPFEGDAVITEVRVTHHGYIPWQGEAALSS
ncbi:hypothetical protein AKJ64_03050 [candidate division MSBL1 archaeon SCGC-AAA259E17]|uniref:Carboxypeptidase regulatory-like domain-containing protein n=1 Tax=candidate division MSBL1 archaeon SCGC-AAA259E17 TaxID=1698263 RepID=A0A133UE90_9EURY|nr:hypothetical protein AKJ64_03050 [candidate division MSBL1 archaeon SCGC-AAA259E17]